MEGNQQWSDAAPDPQGANGPALFDILWVIDNGASMCGAQQTLRNGIAHFADLLLDADIDFHLGFTTTHPLQCEDVDPGDHRYEACQQEPVARPGHLQATPQPIPAHEPACVHPIFPSGHSQAGEHDLATLDPLTDTMELAVSCTKSPAEWESLLWYDEHELRCALPGQPLVDNCEQFDSDLADFFPPQQAYRDIPQILRRQDYTVDETGSIDEEALKADLFCASLVGTRGYAFGQGLAMAVKAVSSEMTGGPGGDPQDYPNAGLLRPDANTSIIFVSNENDCSHDGGLDETTPCGVHNCTIEENLGDEGHLIPVEDLFEDFMENLAASKGLAEVNPDTVHPVSIHGPHRRVAPEDIPVQCPAEGEIWSIEPSCHTEMGRGWSGHRYEYFLRQFPTFFPPPFEGYPDDPIEGLICQNFGPILFGPSDF